MPKSKRRFIDKKNAVSFHLVHRSQKDPLVTDELAPQHVLLETASSKNIKETPEEIAKRKTEQRKFGIFFDDEYNYLQHLRSHDDDKAVHWEYIPPVNLKNKAITQNESQNDSDPSLSKPKSKSITLNLPSSVFASEYEEDEGLLRKAAAVPGPRPDLEPDIVAALDDDFDFENPDNQLDDNFMEMAMGGEGDEDDENEYGSDKSDFSFDSNGDMADIDSNEENDQLGPLRSCRFDNEDTKSRFTEYSMSSSVMRRNEQLSLLDDRFEKFYENYEENEIGALDCEEIEGHVELNEDLLAQCMVELKRDGNDLPYDRKWDEKRIRKIQEEESSDEELIEVEVDDDEAEKKWDCQSMLSTYSNKYNHPKVISDARRKPTTKIRINQKTGVPTNVFHGDNAQLTLKSITKLNTEVQPSPGAAGPKSLCDQSVLSTLSVLSIRPKDESAEEKRHRKRLLKEYKTERRVERKANQNAFKDEKKRQIQITQNNKNNIQGNRIL